MIRRTDETVQKAKMGASLPAPTSKRGELRAGSTEPTLPAETQQALADILSRMKTKLPSSPLALKIMAQLANSASPEAVLDLLERESGRGSANLLAATLAGVATELHALRRSEQRFRAFFERSTVGMATTDWSKRWIDVNDALCAMLGYTRAEMQARTWAELTHPDDLPGCEELLEELRKGHINECDAEKRYLHKDGHAIHVRVAARLLGNRDQQTDSESDEADALLILVIKDVTEHTQIDRALREKNEFLDSILRSEPECVKVVALDGQLRQMNEAGLKMLGAADLNEVRTVGLASLVLPRFRRAFLALHESACKGASGVLEFQVQALDGVVRWLETHATPLRDANGAVNAVLGITRDISDKKRSAELIWKQANFDQLTNLPNRYMFQDRLAQDIKKARRADTSVALLLIDLDNFREVNDTLGHETGDSLLVAVGQRLSSCVRDSDTVARLGGDEFAVILPQLGTYGTAEQIAQTIIDHLGEVFSIGGETVVLSASVGITYFPTDARTVDGLLKNADQAMYVAKQQGRNRIGFFTATLREEAQNRLRLINDLRGALAEDQLRVHFQPIIDLATRRICGAEALLRWHHPTRGMVPPGAFIPLAEETGLIVGIGDWVFRESARWAKRWADRTAGKFSVAINQSPVQFRDRHCVLGWLEHLKKLDLPGRNITIEITEGLLLRADAGTTELLRRLHENGIRVAIDDFGTGYSSLSYLHKFQVDTLKIDQSFVRNLHIERSAQTLSESIILMAHKLGLSVVAEGVETVEQRDFLSNAGCDFAQGFLFARPMPPEEFDALLGVDSGSAPAA
jgi:diguanylate cyclase (GGDEF)-like protein/PAS domain S-box-containing protein